MAAGQRKLKLVLIIQSNLLCGFFVSQQPFENETYQTLAWQQLTILEFTGVKMKEKRTQFLSLQPLPNTYQNAANKKSSFTSLKLKKIKLK